MFERKEMKKTRPNRMTPSSMVPMTMQMILVILILLD